MFLEIIDNKETFQELIILFSKKLYPNHTIPNLICFETIDKNFDKGFVLNQENQIVAMACLIKNPELYYLNKKTICISHYECFENQEFCNKLLFEIEKYCKELEYEYIIGPMNGSTWNSYRFASNLISDNYFSEIYHKSYYANQLENFGFETITNYYTNLDSNLEIPEINSELENQLKFRKLDIYNFREELEKIYELSIKTFKPRIRNRKKVYFSIRKSYCVAVEKNKV